MIIAARFGDSSLPLGGGSRSQAMGEGSEFKHHMDETLAMNN